MAGTKSTSQCSLLKPVSVPQCMQDGEKFIKWDEDSGSGTPVTLRVDAEGFYLYWVDQNKEMDMLDITSIRDARTGKYAKIPKDSKLKQIVTMGSQDTLEEKTVTICYGSDFVNLTYINFCCTKKDIAQLWTEEILKIVYNMLQLNSSTLRFLKKVHSRLTLLTDKTGKIPIKNVIKIFTQNKEDRKRVEKALDISGFPSGKNDALSLQKFQFEDFFNFYKNLTQRTEVEKIFEELCGTQKRRFMTAAQFVEFLNKTQRDPRLNEILYPYANTSRAKDLIQQYEPNKYNAQRGQLSFDGFLQYLMSEDNPIISASKLDLSDDMDQPLPHYFINSSHNTYLTGHQLTGKSAVEMYRQCLLAGCRCVELDFWNGRTEEPVIVHGYTFVPEIPAKEVIEAIAESAFKTSDYPVILSFENHCNPRQQAKIAQYCREIFGENLLDAPLESHKLEPGSELPPPSLLRRKIIIKNKKKHHHHHHKKNQNSSNTSDGSSAVAATQGNGDVPHVHAPPLQSRQGSKDSTQDDDDDDDESSSADEIEDDVAEETKGLHDKIPAEKAAAQETEAGAEISALVNYVQPVHFSSFENSEKKNRPYEMSSFDEKQATTLLKESPVEFVNYNKHQLSRVYPSGTRFDSSNFMPQVFWNAGCQLVALNYQTLDLAMQLNLGIFEYNHRCGYLLKPEFMRRQDRRLDPFAESTVDGIIAGTVSVHVISAQFLTDRRVGVYVEVDMFGLPADTVRKKFRTKIVPNNGINPIFDEEAFVFKKVVLPELASLRIAAYEESGRLIGHRVLPVVGLCPGYRHIALRNESGQPLPLATLFVHVVVKDYVPDTMSDFAEALANPIKYQSELEKREQQLAILTDDTDIVEDQEETAPTARQQRSPSTCVPAMAVKMVSAELTLMGPDRSPRPSLAHAFVSTDSSGSFSGVPVDGAADGAPVDGTLPQKTQERTENTTKTGPPPVNNCPSDSGEEELVAESLEKLMENKAVKEKKLELEKKLESLRKKHEKERARIQIHKSSQDSEKSKSKFSMSHKLVKRLSSKNITDMQHQHHHESSELSESEGETTRHAGSTGLPRSHSERLLAMFRDHIHQERELHERYHELVYSAVEKLMAASQASQMKLLRALLDRETAEVMRRLQSARRDEVKALAKVHRDRDEMVRVKREVDAATVDRGVAERMRLTQLYERRRCRLETAHEQVRQKFQAEKEKAQTALKKEYEGRFAKIEEELKAAKANFDVAQ
ncbi:1-phosphatidylinositol 4,5-bisphosphate phosphodiesterase classes I and II [Schistocerca gregaria]|uniref:1-phosphatidylinositol 4,5-bisphosphate phosphodiesterase classes I and II n=1 Tax=Schistocerca gregaria TaxID=7010 RepID=UPI00211E791A|nr:1-phosphatidylinositol 4,5-bisphosphate phosphodiesterase classes I and II [Schistocerca gregaria]XP_049835191.1 1-phosphatidylinositol 4,5-bisphosphate phosphodiesterase classes I and II [Schistocerca gregaria]